MRLRKFEYIKKITIDNKKKMHKILIILIICILDKIYYLDKKIIIMQNCVHSKIYLFLSHINIHIMFI